MTSAPPLVTPCAGRWSRACPDGRIECRLCPRGCKLRDGQRGFCFVRQRVGDHIELTAYGRTSGFQVDPIEKKPLYHFLPGTTVFSFGTIGCNLGCRFCQNWEISKAGDSSGLTEFSSPEHVASAALRLGCRSVAFTYNDPVIFAEYAIDVAQACHSLGIHTVAVTAGYITPEARGPFFAVMDAANVDLKSFTDDFYRRLCLGHLRPVLDTLRYLHRETSVWLEVTTLLIPGENDSSDEIERASDWFAAELGPDVPWHFTAYHPDFKLRAPPTPLRTLERARDIARRKGIRYVYIGNLRGGSGSNTSCPFCGKLLVERAGFDVRYSALSGGRCPSCHREIAGCFESQPGSGDESRIIR